MALELKNICKSYHSKSGTVHALKDISMTVEKGKFTCILGRSGCGKSTLLNIIAGFESRSSGEIFLDEKEIKGIGTDRIMMFQESVLFPWMNVINNVEFGMKMAGIKKEERKKTAINYLDMVSLTKFKDSYIHQLSGGMKQRVALARALAMNSEILLMDEPFSALDAYTKNVMHDELLRIWEETEKTILFVTHDVEEAIMLADTIVIMSPNPGIIKKIIEIPYARSGRRDRKSLENLAAEIKADLQLEGEDYEEAKSI